MSDVDPFSPVFSDAFGPISTTPVVTVASVQAQLATAKTDLANLLTAVEALQTLIASIDTNVGSL